MHMRDKYFSTYYPFKMKIILVIATSFLLSCSSAVSPDLKDNHDEQFIQIFFHHGLFNELDTFHGTYQKDLVADGTIKTTMWLTKREQEIILTKLENYRFFTLPDTIPKQRNVIISPDMGIQILKVKYGDTVKTVVWHETAEQNDVSKYYIDEINSLLIDIIVSKPEYKALPPVNGFYLSMSPE